MILRSTNKTLINPNKQPLEFQIVDWRAYDNRSFNTEDDDEDASDEDEGQKVERKYLIEIYGFDKEKRSVCLTATDFTPYFFVEIPSNWSVTKLNLVMDRVKAKVDSYIRNDLIDWKVVKRKKFFGFCNEEQYTFIRLTFKSRNAFYAYKKQFDGKIDIQINKCKEVITFKDKMYESDMDPMLRFIHLRDIDPAGWIKVEIKEYALNANPSSKCNLDFTCHWKKIHKSSEMSIGPMRIMSFDIECTSVDGSFPKYDRVGDKIIQIGSTCHEYGTREIHFRHIATLGKSGPVDGDGKGVVMVESFATERDLLLGWAKMVEKYDPDIVTGYNIFGFDWEYLYMRAKLGMGNSKRDYSVEFLKFLSRSRKQPGAFLEKELSSSALGDNMLKYVDCPGRVPIDLLKLIQKDHKLDSYKLDNVAEHFLKVRKIDLKPYQIFEKFAKGTPSDIAEIATYCIRDCELCNQLVIKLEVITGNTAMANISTIPFAYLFLRGQGIKIFSLVGKYCQKEGYLIKTKENTNSEYSVEGAYVFTPEPKIWMDPIVVLDYNSLYPSSMISENLSPDTLVDNPKYLNLPDWNYNSITYDVFEGKGDDKKKIGETTSIFAEKKNGDKGILPRILMQLLKARADTRAKIPQKSVELADKRILIGFVKDKGETLEVTGGDDGKTIVVQKTDVVGPIKDAYNEFQKAILDGRQLALKITANSIYGQTGAPTSKISCEPVAASTTATGRRLLRLARDSILEKYPGTICIYGDTDSCFYNFAAYIEATFGKNLTSEEKLKKSYELGVASEKYMSTILKYPHNCGYEKIFYPFMIFTKKRYVGNKYEKDMTKYKQAAMGIALKRRDYAPIVKIIYNNILDWILNKRDQEGAKGYFKEQVVNLLSGNIDMKELLITKNLGSGYANPTTIAHKVLADRMGERDPGNKPQSNDRMSFCFIDASELKCYECGAKKIKENNCKCIKCLHMFCIDHLNSKKHKCKTICRFCRTTDNLSKCDTCQGWYCADDMVKHNKRTDKYKVEHHDKCKKELPTKLLQGDIIETPDYIKEEGLTLNYRYYLDHQISVPCLQIFELMMKDPQSLIRNAIREDDNKKNGDQAITKWFKPIATQDTNVEAGIDIYKDYELDFAEENNYNEDIVEETDVVD